MGASQHGNPSHLQWVCRERPPSSLIDRHALAPGIIGSVIERAGCSRGSCHCDLGVGSGVAQGVQALHALLLLSGQLLQLLLHLGVADLQAGRSQEVQSAIGAAGVARQR